MKTTDTPTAEQYRAKDAENADLRARLEEAEETLRAIREGEVDAVIVSGSKGDRVFALSESDSLHRLMVETMNEAGLAATHDGLLVFCNDRAAALFGRTKEQLLGHDLAEFADPAEAERVRQLLHSAAVAPADARIEFRASAGMPVPMHVWASRLERPDSPLICLVATDLSRVEADRELIDELQRQREQLRASEELNIKTLQALPAHIAVIAPDGRIVSVNEAWAEFARVNEASDSAAVTVGANYLDVCRRTSDASAADAAQALAGIAAVLSGAAKQFSMEYACHSPEEKRWFLMTVTPLGGDGSGGAVISHFNITERKRAEEALFHSQQAFKALADNAPDIVARYDRQFRHLFVNSRVEKVTGLAVAHFLGKTNVELGMPHNLCEKWEALTLAAFSSGVEQQGEFVFPSSEGPISYDMRLVPEFAPDGSVETVISVARDITERKRAEQELTQTKTQLETLLATAPVGFCHLDRELRYLLINDRLAEMNGLPAADHLGKTVAELVPTLAPEVQAVTARILATGEAVVGHEFSGDAPAQPGVTRWWSESWYPVHDASGAINGFGVIVDDITERKQAEDTIRKLNAELEQRVLARTAELERANLALRKSQELLNETQRISKVGGWEYDVATRRVSWTEEVYRIHGVTADYNASEPEQDIQFYAPDDRQRVADAFRRAVEEGTPYDLELQLITAQGAWLWVRTKGQPECENGKVVHVSGNIVDISEIRSAQAALTEANATLKIRAAELSATNRELEAFCYSVSHDLRTPLRSMDGFSQALLEDYGPVLDATGKDFLQRVRSSSQRMGRLIDDLLNLSRLTRAHMRHTTVDLTALAESTVAELRKAEPSRTVNVRIAPGLTAKGDPTLLGTALSNLLENAWKFTSQRPDALIEVRAERLPVPVDSDTPPDAAQPPLTTDQTVFFVRDNGVGFDMKYADKLFTPFQRLHAITDFPGSGIGLATVQRVIHRHGGRVWVESTPGQGATFYFTLELEPAKPPQ